MTPRCLAIDPGSEQSAFVLYDHAGERILDHGFLGNVVLLNRLRAKNFGAEPYVTVIEQIEGYGMPVGKEVLETVFWSGRFAQASRPFDRVPRKAVKKHLCGKTNLGDTEVNRALSARFGGGFPAGFKGHQLAALAVAVTWTDQQLKKESAA